MLEIKFANRFESLERALADRLATPPDSPFAADEIIVPSAAIRRRVELALADRFGICANVRFSFLARWLWRQIGQLVPVGEVSPFTTPVLAWRVLAIVTEPAFVAAHPRIKAYLAHADDAMRYELAVKVASLFEQYLTYRSDWLARWLAGDEAPIADADPALRADERWQAALWRRVARDLGADRRHPSVAFFEALAAMGDDAPRRAGLPRRAYVFCLPTTPPLYLDVLRGLARWIDLTLYVLNPCREYWLEAVDPRRLADLAARDRAAYHEVGNRLLASWGKQTQAHIALLLADESATVVDDADFAPGAGDTLLVRVQNAILDMIDLPAGAVALAADDRSIEVHVCHSLTRELEVLQDQLLALFAGALPPHPSEVLIVLPDLEAAAPLIDAVFGNAPKSRAIPYAITGRGPTARNAVARALMAVLRVATSRFTASAVFELLQQPIVARRFALDAAALEHVREWMRAAGIRWGIDERHRADLELPRVREHSFEDGLDRLFLGYALPAASVEPVQGLVAEGNVEGSAALALGSFRAFVSALERVHDALRRPQAPAEWRATLGDIAETFMLPQGDEIDDAREVSAAIAALDESMRAGGVAAPLAAAVVVPALEALLDDPARGGVPTGAVTFAAMASLRNVPYRVIGVLGLNDGAFPSLRPPLEFDLMARAPRATDRQRRSDDRNLFLDLILAARERLHLSYTGRSVRDNAVLPPSVVVAELLDYVGAAIAAPEEDPARAARRRVVVEHPLQPFSAEYFAPGADPRRVSYHAEYCAALAARAAAAAAPLGVAAAPLGEEEATDEETGEEASVPEPQALFFQFPLAPPGAEYRDVALERLQRFFRNPCRYLLHERLALTLPWGEEELQDDEPFVADWRARGELAQRVLPLLLAGRSLADIRPLARATSAYPAGRLGDVELDVELGALGSFVEGFADDARTRIAPASGTVACEIAGETWRVSGELADLTAGGLLRYRYDEVRPMDYVNGWIAHVFLNALAPAGVVARTTWHSRDGRYVLPPLADAPRHLATLLALYREGLAQPLHFFPRTAWCYMTRGRRLAYAAGVWSSPYKRSAEGRDASYRLALRGVPDPLDADFERCAIAVFEPMLAVIDDPRIRTTTARAAAK